MRFAIAGTTKIDSILRYDVVIVGAGIAGLYTALNIDERYSCLILAKEKIEISNSWFAQGGIAAAISQDDAPIFHLEDTLIAGAGLCDKDAVGVLVDEGPHDINSLFDLEFRLTSMNSGLCRLPARAAIAKPYCPRWRRRHRTRDSQGSCAYRFPAQKHRSAKTPAFMTSCKPTMARYRYYRQKER